VITKAVMKKIDKKFDKVEQHVSAVALQQQEQFEQTRYPPNARFYYCQQPGVGQKRPIAYTGTDDDEN